MAYTYKELQGSGHISSLTSEAFRRDLADYYAYIEPAAVRGLEVGKDGYVRKSSPKSPNAVHSLWS